MKEPAYWPLNFLEYEIPEDLPRRADTKYGSMEEMTLRGENIHRWTYVVRTFIDGLTW